MAHLLTGFDVARIGALDVMVTDSGGVPTSMRYVAGTYAHVDLSGVMGASAYLEWATKFEDDLNAQATLDGTYTVTWAAATGYTISATGGGNVTLDFSGVTTPAEGTRMRQLLGMSGDRSGAASYSSQVTPYYYLALSRSAPAGYSRPFKPSGQTKRGVSVNGNAYSVRPTTRERRVKMQLRFQSLATVFADEASASVPWTYEDLLDHAGAWEPVLLDYDAATDPVFTIVDPEFSEEARKPVWNDYHGKWDLSLEGQYLGAI